VNFKFYKKPQHELINSLPFVRFLLSERLNFSIELLRRTQLTKADRVIIGYDKDADKMCVKKMGSGKGSGLKIVPIGATGYARMGQISLKSVIKFFNLEKVIVFKTRIYPDVIKKGYLEFYLNKTKPIGL
jgi:hypothetical protein